MPRPAALHKIKLDFKLAIRNLSIEWNKYSTVNWPNISGRYSHSSCIHSQYLYVFGGCTTGSTSSNNFRTQANLCTTFNDLWQLSLNDKTWSKPLTSGSYPPPKACASMVSYKNKLYLFAGWTHCSAYPLNQDWKLFNDLHEFDLNENKWTLVKPTGHNASDQSISPPPLAGHSASVIGDRMIVYGGLLYSQGSNFNPICVNKDLWIYEFAVKRWYRKEIKNSDQHPSPRYGHTQIVLDENSLAVVGGCSSPKVLYNDIWILKLDFADPNADWFWKKVTIEPNEAFNSPIFGFHQAAKVDDMIVILSNICTNGSKTIESRRLFRSDENDNMIGVNAALNGNQQPAINHNRLQAQPTQDERKAQLLASFRQTDASPSSQENASAGTADGKHKALKSSIIRLQTIKNEHGPRPRNPMVLHVLDFSRVLSTYKATWLNQVRRYDGPDEIMLYSLAVATNELILFGGIEKVSPNHNLGEKKLEIVSNNVYTVTPCPRII